MNACNQAAQSDHAIWCAVRKTCAEEEEALVIGDVELGLFAWGALVDRIELVQVRDDRSRFPDFIVKVSRKDGLVMTYLWEVKPYSQTKMPVQKRKTQRFIQEAATYAVNQEKWRAADLFCKEHGWQFKVLTEKDLGI